MIKAHKYRKLLPPEGQKGLNLMITRRLSSNTRIRKIHLAVLSVASLAFGAYATSANADVIAGWSFDNATIAVTGASITGIASDSGAISATAGGTHAAATTVYSSPSGNGSLKAFSSNTWAIGDFYEFDVNGAAYSNYNVAFDATGSNTGPRDFLLEYSTNNGTSYTSAAAYSVTFAAFTTSAASTISGISLSFPLTGVSGLTNIRLVDNSTLSVNGGTIGAAGTSRVDNVVISGTPAAAPEPASVGVVAAGAAFLLGRRRQK